VTKEFLQIIGFTVICKWGTI